MAKNAVYNELLKEYSDIRKDTLSKIDKSKGKIKDAKAAIEENNKLMEKATKDGDLDAYAELRADNAKNEEIVKFFESVIANANNNSDADSNKLDELSQKAAIELVRLKEEYTKDFVKALAPAIEVAKESYKQIYLLKMAANKITSNLGHETERATILGLGDLEFLYNLDMIIQSDAYKKNAAKEDKCKGGRIDWLGSARAAVECEQKKWI